MGVVINNKLFACLFVYIHVLRVSILPSLLYDVFIRFGGLFRRFGVSLFVFHFIMVFYNPIA